MNAAVDNADKIVHVSNIANHACLHVCLLKEARVAQDITRWISEGKQNARVDMQERLGSQGAIYALIKLLRQYRDESFDAYSRSDEFVKSEVCRALGNLTTGHHANKEIAAECGGIEVVLSAMSGRTD